MNHLNKDIIFGIRKSKLGVFSVVIAIMGACFLTGKSVAADQVGEQAQVQTQGQEATTSDPESSQVDTSQYGASMPYTRYEADKGNLLGKAEVEQSQDSHSTAIEASDQTYVALKEKGDGVSFKVNEPANVLTVRYTVPDGASGQLDVQVNGHSVQQLDLSSTSNWQYLNDKGVHDSAQADTRARFQFDEVHSLLPNIQLQKGDVVSFVKNKADDVHYGLDFVEFEQAPDPIAQGDNAINIVSKGATPNDDTDDSQALYDAIYEAKQTGKNVYIPAGRFNLNRKVGIDASDMKISGAGIWHTQLHFTSDQAGGGGFDFLHQDNHVEFSDVYLSSNLRSRYGENAQYKAISGTPGKNSHIHDIWAEHFEVGMWIGDYAGKNDMKYTDGLVVENVRLRNNLADGVNFAQGTKNSIVRNSSIRGNGDDGLASWSSIADGTESAVAENNKFLHNTIELGWRAGGIGIFGGKGHEIAYNRIKDNIGDAGIRLTTVFKGHNFDLNEEGIRVHHNLLERTGTKSDIYNKHRGSIDVETRYGDIKNVTIEDNVFVAPFDTGVTDHLNPNGGILNHVEVRNNQTMSQLSRPAQAGLSAPASKPVVQALKVKEKPLQAGAVKASLQPSKVQPSKKQTGLNLKQAKTVTKTVKPNYVLKATNSKQKSFLKAPSALFLYRMMGLRQTV